MSKECEDYDHTPENYDIAFWHCKVCKKELVFIELDQLVDYEKHMSRLEKK